MKQTVIPPGGKPPNEAEELMAELLDSLGLKYKRQYQYASPRRLTADFAVLQLKSVCHTSAACNIGWFTKILIEVQGGVYSRKAHGSVTGVLADIDRLNEATIHGWHMLRFTPDQIEDGTAEKILRRML